jgi:hypothetical protein
MTGTNTLFDITFGVGNWDTAAITVKMWKWLWDWVISRC